jgi:hypothetical protein
MIKKRGYFFHWQLGGKRNTTHEQILPGFNSRITPFMNLLAVNFKNALHYLCVQNHDGFVSASSSYGRKIWIICMETHI